MMLLIAFHISEVQPTSAQRCAVGVGGGIDASVNSCTLLTKSYLRNSKSLLRRVSVCFLTNF